MAVATGLKSAVMLAGAIALCASSSACGSKAQSGGEPSSPKAQRPGLTPVLMQTKEQQIPVEIAIESARIGDSVRLDITGVARRRTAGRALENPKRWDVTAMVDGQQLKRAVNGSARVSRHPIGGYSSELWDVEVSFDVAFTVPTKATSMTVRILAPEEAKPHLATLDITPPPPKPAPKTKHPGKSKKPSKP